MSQLTDFERAVLLKFLAGDDPTLDLLRQQVEFVSVAKREWHGGAGFVAFLELDPAAPSAGSEVNLDISDVVANIEGMSQPTVYIVFVKAGRLAELEGSTFEDENWPEGISQFELSYMDEPRHMPPWERPPEPHSPWWRQVLNMLRTLRGGQPWQHDGK